MMRLNIIALSITLLLPSIASTEGAKLEHMDQRQEDLKGCTLSAMDKCYSTLPPDGTAPNTLVEEIGQVDGPQKCQAFCKDLYSNTCTWFMYDRTTNDCKLFSGSLDDLRADCNEIGYPREPSYDSCDVVFSGDDGCYNFREDYCRFEFGLLDNLDDIETVAECQSACQFIQGCNYFMYDQPSKTCKLNTNVTSSRVCDILHGTPEPDLQTCIDDGKLDWTSESEGSGDSSQSIANPTNPPSEPTTTTTTTTTTSTTTTTTTTTPTTAISIRYSIITNIGYCELVSGGHPYRCVRKDVSSQGCEDHCTSQTSCIGYYYSPTNQYCYLIPTEKSCPSGFDSTAHSGLAASVNDLKAAYNRNYACYGKI